MKENNKLIAEFMGLTPPYELPQYGTIRPGGHFKTEINEEQLRYHQSWDWLMPVIEKCLIGEAEQDEFISNSAIKNIYDGICNQDIIYAHKSVIEFIEFNNKK